MITPREFVDRWAQSNLSEQQAAQSHFNELCELVGHQTPAQLDPEGQFFAFEEQVEKATGGKGRADVWYRGRFAWEYKGKHKNLDLAYAQLSAYRGGLENPPLLVVCDFLEYRIYPQWPNTSGQPFVFKNEDLLNPQILRYITWLLESPEKFLELRHAERIRREKITLELAYKFAHLADLMRQHTDEQGKPLWESMQIARFLTKVVFALFATDIGLIPYFENRGMVHYMADAADELPEVFASELTDLFKAMDGQRKSMYGKYVPYFNGNLFLDSKPGANDGLEVLDISQVPGALQVLREVSAADWRLVNPTIFGTLFEGALDESKRAQLGAHYTSEEDIRLVIEPVLMQPLHRLWDEIRTEAEPLMQIFLKAETPKSTQQAKDRLIELHDRMMDTLESTRVLDPACGSGNFLYMSLRAMKDLEGGVRHFFEPVGLPFRDVVTPRQIYGIEKDEFAAKLAHVVVWIGYLQWRYDDEGILHYVAPIKRPHPRALSNPILKDKIRPDEPERIICDDSIMRYDADGTPYEPLWPDVDIVVSNPPFLGDKRMRSELGDTYVDNLRRLYSGRVPGGADLVTYWYEKARALIERGKDLGEHRRAGMLATNSIRTGANRTVLDRIKNTGNIFMAWSDRPWVLEGAAVRISVVGFDDGTEKRFFLDDVPVTHINSDLQNTIDATQAKLLPENKDLAFIGIQKGGNFEISSEQAQAFFQADAANKQVIQPWINAEDIVARPKNRWIINFKDMPFDEVQKFAAPLQYLEAHVKPAREKNRDKASQECWWQFQRYRPALMTALEKLNRFIATPRVAKHRLFVWVLPHVLPDSRIVAIAREDDYFWGVLHSRIHEIWSIRLASWHGVGNDPTYNAQSCFETFPFPYLPGRENFESPIYKTIGETARQLYEERETWLNPPELIHLEADLKERTLTNLYNALEKYREANGGNHLRENAAATFVPRLAELHDTLDKAVLAAYGWDDLAGRLRTSEGDEELLRRLLALNLTRAGKK